MQVVLKLTGIFRLKLRLSLIKLPEWRLGSVSVIGFYTVWRISHYSFTVNCGITDFLLYSKAKRSAGKFISIHHSLTCQHYHYTGWFYQSWQTPYSVVSVNAARDCQGRTREGVNVWSRRKIEKVCKQLVACLSSNIYIRIEFKGRLMCTGTTLLLIKHVLIFSPEKQLDSAMNIIWSTAVSRLTTCHSTLYTSLTSQSCRIDVSHHSMPRCIIFGVNYSTGSLCKGMCAHIHLRHPSRVGEGSSISTLQQGRGWMSVLVISEWNKLQNFLTGCRSHVEVVQFFINAVCSSRADDKPLAPRAGNNSSLVLASSVWLSKWITHCGLSSDRFIQRVDGNALDQNRAGQRWEQLIRGKRMWAADRSLHLQICILRQ